MYTSISKFLVITLLLLLSQNSYAQMKWRISSVTNAVYQKDSSGKLLYLPQDSTIYFFNAQNNRGSSIMNDTIHCDGFEYYKLAVGGALPLHHTGHYIYNSNGDVQEVYRMNGVKSIIDTIGKDEYTYVKGFMIKHKNYNANSGSPDLFLRTQAEYSYDANGRVTQERHYTGSHLYQRRYLTYNSNGQIVTDSIERRSGNGWIWDELQMNTYNTAGEKVYTRSWLPPGCGTMMIKYYDYNDDGLISKDSSFFWANVNQPNNGAIVTHYTYTKNGLPKDIIRYSGTGASSGISSKIAYEYTSFGYLSSITSLSLKNNVLEPTYQTSLSYQHYWPTRVNDVSSNNSELAIYPVPTKGVLNIQLAIEQPTELTARIVNLQGQEVQVWADNANGVYQKAIATKNLPAGHYYLSMSTPHKTYTKPFVVMKN